MELGDNLRGLQGGAESSDLAIGAAVSERLALALPLHAPLRDSRVLTREVWPCAQQACSVSQLALTSFD